MRKRKRITRVNIEAERLRLGLEKAEICAALGVSSKTYTRYIQGASIPSWVLLALRQLTGCSIDYLLGVV